MHRRLKRALIVILMVTVIVILITLTLGRELLADRQPTMGSFTLIHFAGYLFFLVMPVEVLVPYYLSEGHLGLVLVPVAVVTALAAQLIDYGIGYLVSDRVINHLVGQRRYARAERVIHRYGRWAIFLFTALPLSSPTLLLAAGIVRFRLDAAVVYSIFGLTIKYLVIVFAFGGVW